MNKRPIGYFEKDGSYNEREPRRTKPRTDDSFRLDFEHSIAVQVSLKMDEHHQREIVRCAEACRVLHNAGCLPGNHLAKMQRRINLKADRYVRKFKKDTTP